MVSAVSNFLASNNFGRCSIFIQTLLQKKKMDLIKGGDFIVIQRQSYMKTHKLPGPDKKPALVALGKTL